VPEPVVAVLYASYANHQSICGTCRWRFCISAAAAFHPWDHCVWNAPPACVNALATAGPSGGLNCLIAKCPHAVSAARAVPF
jgi:hypothetical protein